MVTQEISMGQMFWVTDRKKLSFPLVLLHCVAVFKLVPLIFSWKENNTEHRNIIWHLI